MNDGEYNVEYYASLYAQHGDSARSLDWGSRESQERRFEVLAAVGPLDRCTVLDVGCGLGDFGLWLRDRGYDVDYTGVEITPAFAQRAAARLPDARIVHVDFNDVGDDIGEFDYVFGSGLFYLYRSEPYEKMNRVIARMYRLARRAIAFNSLGTWGRQPSQGEFLADPLRTLEYCRSLTQRVVLRHDYYPGDFSVYLYKGTGG